MGLPGAQAFKNRILQNGRVFAKGWKTEGLHQISGLDAQRLVGENLKAVVSIPQNSERPNCWNVTVPRTLTRRLWSAPVQTAAESPHGAMGIATDRYGAGSSTTISANVWL